MIWKKSHTAVYFYFYFFFIPPIFCSEPTTIFLDFIHLHDYPLTGFLSRSSFSPSPKAKVFDWVLLAFCVIVFLVSSQSGPPGVATIYVLLLINAALFDTLCFRSSDDLIRRPCDFESVLPPKSSANVVVPVMVCLDGAPWHDLDGHLFSILRVFLYFLSIMSG